MAVNNDVKQWLKDHNLWTAFWKRRDEHKGAGDTPAVAQARALGEFYDPKGEPVVAQAQAGDSTGGGN